MADFIAPPRLLGIRVGEVETGATPTGHLGERGFSYNGNEYQYVKFGGTVAAGDALTISALNVAIKSGANAVWDAVAIAAAVSGNHGWVLLRGVGTAKVTASMAAGAHFGAITTTGGVLNTAATGADGIRGKLLTAEASGSATVRIN